MEFNIKFSESKPMTAEFESVQKVSTGNYEDLTNKPQIEGIELIGNLSFDDLGLGDKLSDYVSVVTTLPAVGKSGVRYLVKDATDDKYQEYIYVNDQWYYISSTDGGSSLPSGGTIGQALIKASNLDGDVKWDDVSGEIQSVATKSDLYALQNTYRGMIVYVIDEDEYYRLINDLPAYEASWELFNDISSELIEITTDDIDEMFN